MTTTNARRTPSRPRPAQLERAQERAEDLLVDAVELRGRGEGVHDHLRPAGEDVGRADLATWPATRSVPRTTMAREPSTRVRERRVSRKLASRAWAAATSWSVAASSSARVRGNGSIRG
jgi:hypothetical protein